MTSTPIFLLKIPFLLSILWGTHATLTPPQSPPSSTELVGKDRLEVGIASILKICSWVTCLMEVAAILASLSPSGEISKLFLGALAHGSSSPRTSLRITKTFLAGWLLNLIGALLRRRCYKILDKLFTFELSIREDHKLITSGPYSFVRHPSYTGAALAGFGVILSHLNRGSWVVQCSGLIPDSWAVMATLWLFGVIIVVYVIGPRLSTEDHMLHDKFGREWENWAAAVPYRLVPYVY